MIEIDLIFLSLDEETWEWKWTIMIEPIQEAKRVVSIAKFFGFPASFNLSIS
jgi:hypothetical protein